MADASTTLTVVDNGRMLDVSEGDTLVLRLHENASTGYRWAFDGLDRAYIEVQERDDVRRAAAIGAGGETEWALVAKKRGVVEVRLKRWRHWEGDRSIRERFAVTLRIR